jgi:predicted amidophosphoribosyltransferase
VDDVMTSGHTANALAESLLRSGAVEVRVWVVARA